VVAGSLLLAAAGGASADRRDRDYDNGYRVYRSDRGGRYDRDDGRYRYDRDDRNWRRHEELEERRIRERRLEEARENDRRWRERRDRSYDRWNDRRNY
jgi:hypothetical protein